MFKFSVCTCVYGLKGQKQWIVYGDIGCRMCYFLWNYEALVSHNGQGVFATSRIRMMSLVSDSIGGHKTVMYIFKNYK